jgi:Transglutaminase-like superfamily
VSIGDIGATPGTASAAALGHDGDPRCFRFDKQAMANAVALQTWPSDMQTNWALALARANSAIDHWVHLGLPSRNIDGIAHFDFGHMLNFMRREGLADRDPVYKKFLVPMARRQAADQMTIPPPVEAPCLHSPRRFSISLTREIPLTDCKPGDRLRLRLPMPYPDPAQTDISVEAKLDGAAGDVGTVQPARLDFLVRAPDTCATVTLAAQITLTLYQQQGGTLDIDANTDQQIYLRRRDGLVQVTPAVEDLARRLAGHLDDPLSIMRAFWTFLFTDLRLGYLHHHELDPADPLMDMVRRGWFDCLGGGALLIALARSRGIPARLIHGICPSELAPSFHYWIEVWFEGQGWVPIDLMCWDFSEGRRDVDPWSDLLFGRLGYRVKCQRFPRIVTGPVGVRQPRECAWLLAPASHGAMMAYYDIADGRLAYRDILRVVRLS